MGANLSRDLVVQSTGPVRSVRNCAATRACSPWLATLRAGLQFGEDAVGRHDRLGGGPPFDLAPRVADDALGLGFAIGPKRADVSDEFRGRGAR